MKLFFAVLYWGAWICAMLVSPLDAAVHEYAVPNDPRGRSLRLNVPDSVSQIRGVIIYGNGAGGDVRSMATNAEIVALAELHGFAVVGTAYWRNFAAYWDPLELNWFETGLQEFATASGHSELVRAPWVPIGHSNGGQMSYGFNSLRPHKVIAFLASKGSYYTTARPDQASLATPGILVAGELDPGGGTPVIRDLFFGNRPRGALWAWVEDQGVGHERGDSDELTLPYMDAMIRRRYPGGAVWPETGTVPLLALDPTEGWLTEPQSHKAGLAFISDYAGYPGDRATAGWLPTRSLAYIFRAFASYGKATRTATLSPGRGPLEPGVPITYAIGEPVTPWTLIEFYEGDTLLKRSAPGDTDALAVEATPTRLGYSVYHALVTCADGTQRTTIPRRVFVRGVPQAPTLRGLTGGGAYNPGERVILRAEVFSVSTPVFQWQKDGVPIRGATGETLTLEPAGWSDSGRYSVVATNESGTSSSPEVSVNVAFKEVGTAFGALSTGEPWSVHADRDGRAVFLGFLGGSGQVILGQEFLIAADGTFRFRASARADLPSSLQQRFFRGWLSGRISGHRVVGRIEELGVTFEGEFAAGGAAASLAGFYAAAGETPKPAAILASVGENGAALVVGIEHDGCRASTGAVDAQGGIRFADPEARMTGRLGAEGSLSGQLACGDGEYVPVGRCQPPGSTGRLRNLSARGGVGVGQSVLIAGFVLSGPAEKAMLVRAVGPTLSRYLVSTPLPDPRLELVRDGVCIAANDDWLCGGFAESLRAMAERVGAFPLPEKAEDAALLSTTEPGSFSAVVSGAGGATGVALVEIYDAGAAHANATRLINFSLRADVVAGDAAPVIGFVTEGERTRVLIRAIGPALSRPPFAITGALAMPVLTVYDSRGRVIVRNRGHGRDAEFGTSPVLVSFERATPESFRNAGAFELPAASHDAALVLVLPAGGYTVHISAENGQGGLGLLELYDTDR